MNRIHISLVRSSINLPKNSIRRNHMQYKKDIYFDTYKISNHGRVSARLLLHSKYKNNHTKTIYTHPRLCSVYPETHTSICIYTLLISCLMSQGPSGRGYTYILLIRREKGRTIEKMVVVFIRVSPVYDLYDLLSGTPVPLRTLTNELWGQQAQQPRLSSGQP